MSDAIMKALMQLFALISDIHDDTIISAREKNIVKIFLLRHLNNDLVTEYMKMFEEYLSACKSERIKKGSLQDRKRISLNAIRILALCEKINEELQQRQKVYVLVKLVDYISLGEEITETELDFLQTVASAFNISEREYQDIRCFIMNKSLSGCEGGNILIVDGRKDLPGAGFRHMCNENLKGTVSFLRVKSTNTYLVRYSGLEVLYLNGQNIQEEETYIFDSGSSLRGSGIRAVYYCEIVGQFTSSSRSECIILCAENVTFRFRHSENGVHNLNFTGRSGELAGVLGGSGVGKSTTLSILSGTLRPAQGHVFVNGYDLYNDDDRDSLKGVIGFVPQDDLLIDELTVYQNLYFNAKMCLGNLKEVELRQAVDKILNDLDLAEARDLKVGNPLNKVISGGQRKRINIALELMREPSILFVDEPTSGLSSIDSEMVMNLLKELTYKGKLVIVNIHQPSSDIYKMFDRIMIIDKGGYQVYCGNPNEAIIYFKVQTNHSNPDEDQCVKCGNIETDRILQIIESKVLDEKGKATRIRKVSPGEWAKRFEEFSGCSKEKEPVMKQSLPAVSFHKPGLLKQTAVFFRRDLLSKLANTQYITITLLGPPLLAFILAYFTKTPSENYRFSNNENIPAYLFMCIITSMFFGLMGSSEEIVRDRKILKRESFLDLSWFSYLNSKVIIMFIVSAIQTLAFAVTGNFILEIKGMNASYWLVLFTTSCFANILGLNLSSAFRSVISIYILIPFIIIPQLLFSGVLVKFDKLHTPRASSEFVPVIGDLMAARWAYEAIAVRQFRYNDYEKHLFRAEAERARFHSYYLVADHLQNNTLSRIGLERNPVLLKADSRKLDRYLQLLTMNADTTYPEKIKNAVLQKNFSQEFRSETNSLLASLKKKYQKLSREAVRQTTRDSIPDADRLHDAHQNERLRMLVLGQDKIGTGEKLAGETPRRIFVRVDQGLLKAASPSGRAHFYAPVKTIAKTEINTYVFDILVIWIVSAILYLLLYFRIAEKLMNYFEKISLRHAD